MLRRLRQAGDRHLQKATRRFVQTRAQGHERRRLEVYAPNAARIRGGMTTLGGTPLEQEQRIAHHLLSHKELALSVVGKCSSQDHGNTGCQRGGQENARKAQ